MMDFTSKGKALRYHVFSWRSLLTAAELFQCPTQHLKYGEELGLHSDLS